MRATLWNPDGPSKADIFARRPLDERKRILASLKRSDLVALNYSFEFWARPKQLPPPGPFRYRLVLAGRRWGKSWAAAQWIRSKVERGETRRIVLAGVNYQEVEKVMVANIQKVFPPDRMPRYLRSNLELRFWPYTDDAPVADLRTSEKPDSFRGHEWDCGWVDELASFDHLEECWLLLNPAMSGRPPKGGNPQLMLTTTPKERKVLYDLLDNPLTVFTEGHSEENAPNLADGTLEAIKFLYSGTGLEDQELGGRLMGSEPGALFQAAWFANNRAPIPPKFKRKLVAVDTSGSGKDTACECGIVVLGLSEDGKTVYLLEDASLRASPETWALRMAKVYKEHNANEILYESNYGGELIPTMFKQMKLDARFKPVPAKGTKAERALPVSALVQGGKVKFVGTFKDFEMQCCTWTPKSRVSPDRLDAFVHGVMALFGPELPRGIIRIPGYA